MKEEDWEWGQLTQINVEKSCYSGDGDSITHIFLTVAFSAQNALTRRLMLVFCHFEGGEMMRLELLYSEML